LGAGRHQRAEGAGLPLSDRRLFLPRQSQSGGGSDGDGTRRIAAAGLHPRAAGRDLHLRRLVRGGLLLRGGEATIAEHSASHVRRRLRCDDYLSAAEHPLSARRAASDAGRAETGRRCRGPASLRNVWRFGASIPDDAGPHRLGRFSPGCGNQRHQEQHVRSCGSGDQFSGIPSDQTQARMTYRYDSRLSFASTLPASYYNDASVLAAENRNIFGRTWQLVGRAEQVREPGQFFTAVVADEPLLIVRGNDGELRALSNVCRHRAGPVAKGEGKRPVLQCGYHGWTYALDGQLSRTPEMDGIED